MAIVSSKPENPGITSAPFHKPDRPTQGYPSHPIDRTSNSPDVNFPPPSIALYFSRNNSGLTLSVRWQVWRDLNPKIYRLTKYQDQNMSVDRLDKPTAET